MDLIKEMESYIKKDYSTISLYSVSPQEVVFEERVKMSCFYCGKYGNNWKCPPKLPDIDYRKMIDEFSNGVLVVNKMSFEEGTYDLVRKDSSFFLHKALLELESYLWNHNYALNLSFIGGSCKLCRNGCGKEQCNNPYEARASLEAIGVNVIQTAKKCGIEISFPPAGSIIRVGGLFW